ncbi:MAG: hypothetical protein IPK80_02485 [Nannocystis sp.]|nr:hypothetical protein [Nannocystis sp.]
MTTAKEHAAEARMWADHARKGEVSAERSTAAFYLAFDAQTARLRWVEALISFLRFIDALPEPVAIPPVPQPSEEARRRGLLVGAVVRDEIDGSLAHIVAHTPAGCAMVQWLRSGLVGRVDDHRLTVIRPAATTRKPNAEAVKRGLYIGARVMCDGKHGEIIAWDVAGDPIVDRGPRLIIDAWSASLVTLTGDAS